MPRKDPQVPPRSSSTINLRVSSAVNVAPVSTIAVPQVEVEPALPDFSDIDFDVLFQCNSEYILIEQHLKHLEQQLQQAHEDIETLKDLKDQAMECPEDFISLLKGENSRSYFPKPQTILRVPDVNVNRYQVRLTRRANTRFEQNLEYLVAKVQEVQMRQPGMTAPVPSNEMSVFDGLISNNNNNNSNNNLKRSFSDMRQDFVNHLPNPSHVNVPKNEHVTTTTRIRPIKSIPDIDAFINPIPPPTPITVHQPRPRQASRFSPAPLQEDYTDLNPMEYHHHNSNTSSRSSSTVPPPVPIIATPVSNPSLSNASTPSVKIRIRKPSSQTPENTSITHNIPWSDDEKRKLDYLLTVYPEEEIQARRYAKIAAALGTRTSNQVASRYQKLLVKAQRQRDREIRPNGSTPFSLDKGTSALVAEFEEYFSKSTDPHVKASPEYLEYLRLKDKLIEISKDPLKGALHSGFSCDACGMDPIIGPRWTCCSCPKEAPLIDLCCDCVSKGFKTHFHKPSHVMKKIDFSEDSSDV